MQAKAKNPSRGFQVILFLVGWVVSTMLINLTITLYQQGTSAMLISLTVFPTAVVVLVTAATAIDLIAALVGYVPLVGIGLSERIARLRPATS